MGLRYVRVEPLAAKAAPSLDLRLVENHKPPAYLATVRLHPDREPAPDGAHVLDVAAPVLARLACADVAAYLEKGRVLERARAAVAEHLGARPARVESTDLVLELGREVAGTLDPRERPVYRVSWRGEHALTYWLGDPPSASLGLAWTSPLFRADPRTRPIAVEHGYSYVPWALGELATVRASLLREPRILELGLPLETGRARD